jgi:hypothetical protein
MSGKKKGGGRTSKSRSVTPAASGGLGGRVSDSSDDDDVNRASVLLCSKFLASFGEDNKLNRDKPDFERWEQMIIAIAQEVHTYEQTGAFRNKTVFDNVFNSDPLDQDPRSQTFMQVLIRGTISNPDYMAVKTIPATDVDEGDGYNRAKRQIDALRGIYLSRTSANKARLIQIYNQLSFEQFLGKGMRYSKSVEAYFVALDNVRHDMTLRGVAPIDDDLVLYKVIESVPEKLQEVTHSARSLEELRTALVNRAAMKLDNEDSESQVFTTSASAVSNPSAAPKGKSRNLCFKFRDTGRCSRGDRCRFSHDKQKVAEYEAKRAERQEQSAAPAQQHPSALVGPGSGPGQQFAPQPYPPPFYPPQVMAHRSQYPHHQMFHPAPPMGYWVPPQPRQQPRGPVSMDLRPMPQGTPEDGLGRDAADSEDGVSSVLHIHCSVLQGADPRVLEIFHTGGFDCKLLWDSGADVTVFGNSALPFLFEARRSTRVVMMNQYPSRATHEGRLMIKLLPSGAVLTLQNVLVVPGSRASILSIPRLQRTGACGVHFPSGSCRMYAEIKGQVIADVRYEGLPATDFQFIIPSCKYNVNTARRDQLHIEVVPDWLMSAHRRLAHLRVTGIRTLVNQGSVIVSAAQKKQLAQVTRIPCEDCDNASLPAKPVPKKSATPPLKRRAGVVRVDIKGPFIKSRGGATWMVGGREDKSGAAFLTFAINKGPDVAAKIKIGIMRLRERFNIVVKVIISDRGAEFLNAYLNDWLQSAGILHEPLTADSPQLNGLMERFWGIIMPRTKAMISTAYACITYWADSGSYATDVFNMLPSRTRNGLSPYQICTGKTPRLSRIQTWGSLALAKNHKASKGGLASQATRTAMLGFSGPDGYKLLNLDTGKAIHSRTVSFYPNVFPWEDKKSVRSPDFEAEQELWETLTEDEPGQGRRQSTRVTAMPYVFDPAAYMHMHLAGEDPRPFGKRWHLQPRNLKQALHDDNPYRDEWWASINKEIKGLVDQGAFVPAKLRPGEFETILHSFFVHTAKTGPKGELLTLKSRFVANGKGHGHHVETYSPTPLWSSIRWLLKFAVDNDLEALHVDVKQAYLLSLLPPGEQVLLRVPEGFPFELPPGFQYLRVLKCLYGLPQSGRHWNKNVHSFITGLSKTTHYRFVQTSADPCLYLDRSNMCAIIVFVDDFIVVGDKARADDVVTRFGKKYPIKNLGGIRWYLCCCVKRERRVGLLHMSQGAFARQVLAEAGMEDCKPVRTPAVGYLVPLTGESLFAGELAKRQGRITGMLLYLAVATRPDISFAVGQLCKFISKPSLAVWKYTKRVLRYLKGTVDFGLSFRKGRYGTKGHGDLVGFSDADHAGCPASRRSWSGAVWLFGGDLISWRCRQQTTVALSSMEAELVALTATAREGQHLCKATKDFRVERPPVTIKVDNQAAMASAKDFRVSQKSKHIATKHFYIRDLVENGTYKLKYVPSQDNLADILTKPLKPATFVRLRQELNIGPYKGGDE